MEKILKDYFIYLALVNSGCYDCYHRFSIRFFEFGGNSALMSEDD